jgi:hypothetical protein
MNQHVLHKRAILVLLGMAIVGAAAVGIAHRAEPPAILSAAEMKALFGDQAEPCNAWCWKRFRCNVTFMREDACGFCDLDMSTAEFQKCCDIGVVGSACYNTDGAQCTGLDYWVYDYGAENGTCGSCEGFGTKTKSGTCPISTKPNIFTSNECTKCPASKT